MLTPSSQPPRRGPARGTLASLVLLLAAGPLGCGGDAPAGPSRAASPAGQLTVVAITPELGSNLGGTKVTIIGTGFVRGAAVAFGGVPATNVVVTGGTMLTAVTPANAAGPVDVVVANPDGRLSGLARRYRYVHPDSLDACAGCWDY